MAHTLRGQCTPRVQGTPPLLVLTNRECLPGGPQPPHSGAAAVWDAAADGHGACFATACDPCSKQMQVSRVETCSSRRVCMSEEGHPGQRWAAGTSLRELLGEGEC